MLYSVLANVTVFIHFLFLVFVVTGALLILKWRWVIFLHIPAALWGALIMFKGWICPLTPLEIRLRRAAGEAGYDEGFIEYYILPLIYPDILTRDLQICLGLGVVLVNFIIYGVVVLLRVK